MGQKKILLVDDSKVTRRSICLLLEKNGYEVLTLDNAEDLLTSAENYSDVRLILLDIGLPGMDGLTALQYINQLSSLNHIPIIILSGYSDRTNVTKALSLNIVDYIIKPYIAPKLLVRIEQAMKTT